VKTKVKVFKVKASQSKLKNVNVLNGEKYKMNLLFLVFYKMIYLHLSWPELSSNGITEAEETTVILSKKINGRINHRFVN